MSLVKADAGVQALCQAELRMSDPGTKGDPEAAGCTDPPLFSCASRDVLGRDGEHLGASALRRQGLCGYMRKT